MAKFPLHLYILKVETQTLGLVLYIKELCEI
jgi:hypothetical protein